LRPRVEYGGGCEVGHRSRIFRSGHYGKKRWTGDSAKKRRWFDSPRGED
jgi:hypothetical protein